MKSVRCLLLISFGFLMMGSAFSQGEKVIVEGNLLIAEQNAVVDSTAIVDIQSTDKGLLIPRMKEAERDQIQNPAKGLLIYCSDCRELQIYNDTAWTNMIGLPTSPSVFLCGDSLGYEGQYYQTKQIGSQCWMTEDLNVGTVVVGDNHSDNSIIEKSCYDDDTLNCNIFGGLYTWDEAMQYSTIEAIKGICPVGWHIPSDNDWKILEIHVGLTQMEADAIGFRGTNQGSQMSGKEMLWTNSALVMDPSFGSSGLDLTPGGFNSPSGYLSKSRTAVYWVSNILSNTTYPHIRYINYNDTRIIRNGGINTTASVRCVRD